MKQNENDLRIFEEQLAKLSLQKFWQGYGSTIFFEFGDLKNIEKRNGEVAQQGEMTLMIEENWRVSEGGNIIAGSSDEFEQTNSFLENIIGKKVIGIKYEYYFKEIRLDLDGSIEIVSFIASRDTIGWTLFDNRFKPIKWLHPSDGGLIIGSD